MDRQKQKEALLKRISNIKPEPIIITQDNKRQIITKSLVIFDEGIFNKQSITRVQVLLKGITK